MAAGFGDPLSGELPMCACAQLWARREGEELAGSWCQDSVVIGGGNWVCACWRGNQVQPCNVWHDVGSPGS